MSRPTGTRIIITEIDRTQPDVYDIEYWRDGAQESVTIRAWDRLDMIGAVKCITNPRMPVPWEERAETGGENRGHGGGGIAGGRAKPIK